VETELSADFAAASNRGLRHHRNEDRVEIKDFGDRQVLVVCDGVSSSIDAQNAAAEAVATLVQKLSDGAELTDALKQAARAVAQLATESSEASPSTTVVAAVVAGRTVRIAWLGDSRAYWISPEGSRQLTTDHSWLNDVVSSGELSYAEAAESPSAHAITRWLGADADPDTEPGVTEFEVPGAGLLLLCTDGLWNYAHETDDIAALVLAKPSASALEIARDLVSFANEKGGQDNITVALLRFAQ
jgi:serine/threonine protein phosphatase PrpC